MGGYYLGIIEGHDAGATLIKDGEIIRASHEERFTRIKHDDRFPINTIKWIFEDTGINISDIEKVGIAGDPHIPLSGQLKVAYNGIKRLVQSPLQHQKISWILYKNKKRLSNIKKKLIEFGFDGRKIKFVNHHICHLSSAYYSSGVSNACLISLDGMGEYRSGLIAKGDNGKMTVLQEFIVPHSLGIFYSAATQFIGFEPMDGEYKTMGLAPYGDSSVCYERASKLIGWKNNDLKINYKYFETTNFPDILKFFYKPKERHFYYYTNLFTKLFQGYKHEDIAAAFQRVLEEVGIKIAKRAMQLTKENQLVVSGGTFLNVKLNKRLMELGGVEGVFPHPASNDGGCSTGAALYLYAQDGGKFPGRMKHAYLGARFDVKRFIDENAIECEKVTSKDVAALVASGKIIGYYNGRAEYGPRALGHRSIIADPRIESMKDTINRAVKFREKFRPFCPSVLKEYALTYFENCHDSPFMTLSFNVISDKIPAVTHIDKTARPQTVVKKNDPSYYSMIKEFGKLSGVPLVLNTSFNRRGEPVVNTPQDAITCFKNSGIDLLVLENYLLRK